MSALMSECSIGKMYANPVTVIVDGEPRIIDADQLRLNDLVFIQAGDIVPADLQLVETDGLTVDEFNLTGEILFVSKNADGADNKLFRGSRITRGSGAGIVIAVGEQTEYGKILDQSQEHTFSLTKNPNWNQIILNVLYLLPAWLVMLIRGEKIYYLLVSFAIAWMILIILQDDQLITNLILIKTFKKFEKRRIIVRDPSALLSMGEIDVICFDKTGVLTAGHMNVKTAHYPGDLESEAAQTGLEEPHPLITLGCALCHEVLLPRKIELANPVDKALIAFAQQHGVQLESVVSRFVRIFDQPFDPENRYMACGFEREDRQIDFFVKGDPGIVINFCDHYLSPSGKIRKIDYQFLYANQKKIEMIHRNGNLVIALAHSPSMAIGTPTNLTFLCLLEIENPLHPDGKDVVNRLAQKNIRSVLLTGDRAESAGRIGVMCNITDNPRMILTGPVIRNLPLAEVARQAHYCSVFARLMPSQKAAVIRVFQQNGHQVVMVGDGPNDAPALRSAEIGITYTQGSSPIARNHSSILIQELTDILSLVDTSRRINLISRTLKVLRLPAAIALLTGIYGHVLIQVFRG